MAGNEDGDGDVSGEEAAWRDLIARFDLPVDTTTRQAPWPARENLAEPSADRQLPEHDTAVGREQAGPGGPTGPASRAGPASLPGPAGGPGPLRLPGSGLPGPPGRGGQDGPGGPGAGPAGQDGASRDGTTQDGTGPAGADGDGFDPDTGGPVDEDGIGWSSTILEDGRGSNGRPRAGPADGRDAATGSAGTGRDGAGPAGSRSARDRAHIVRRAEPVPHPSPPGDDEDDRYVPPPPAPLPQLDSVAKGAWVALLGGPGYLLLATLAGWQIADWAALVAIIAFVAGFATLVLRMSDRPRDDDDDGAVV